MRKLKEKISDIWRARRQRCKTITVVFTVDGKEISRAVTRDGGGLPGRVPQVAFDRTRLAPIALDSDSHTGPALGFASTSHSITSFRPLSKGGNH